MRREARAAGGQMGVASGWSGRGGLTRMLARVIRRVGVGILGLACCGGIAIGRDCLFVGFEGMVA
jgi:hypothetical protein